MTILERIREVQQSILDAELASDRIPGSVKLLAVSKNQSAAAIQSAYSTGLRAFGESYLQEAKEKIVTLSHLDIEWHFIGPIQSNKTKWIGHHFDWVHSVYREKIIEQLNQARSPDSPPLNICVQINADKNKAAGISPDDIVKFVQLILPFPNLRLRGLMMIANPKLGPDELYKAFFQMADMLRFLNQQLHLELDTLSMGMSDDLQIAIKAGSTMVRVGRAIFGERTL